MRRIFSSAKSRLLSGLPVALAREYLVRTKKNPPSSQDATTESLNNGQYKQLLVDVSVIISNDARTGIQRVVRSLLLQLLTSSPMGYYVRPVFCTRKHGYHYAPNNFGLVHGQENVSATEKTHPIKVAAGDIFLGLDLAAHLLPLHKTELMQWKRLGVKIHIIVYDLLPVLHPHWFNPKTTKNFHRWLRTIAIYADSAICISNTVKSDLLTWFRQKYALDADKIIVSTIPLGADVKASRPSRGLPENVDQLLNTLRSKPSILMVGTLEPRKGHRQVLTAFEALWQQGREVNLIIVGKPGWKTDDLQHDLLTHRQNLINLYWLDNASDELLDLLYSGCSGVIVASEAEGFGLPLIEALYQNKPVLARDIPVFREITHDSVTFFSSASAVGLSQSITDWLTVIESPRTATTNFLMPTWLSSAQQLLQSILINQVSGSQLLKDGTQSLLITTSSNSVNE